jgi:TolB-like protein
VADSVRFRIRRLVPQRELYVISRDAMNSVLETEWPGPVWQIDDVREIGKELRADIILEIGATRVTTGIRLEPLLIRGRRGEPERLAPIEAPTLGRAATVLARRIAADSSLRRSHALSRRPANER